MKTRSTTKTIRRVLMLAGACTIPALFTGCGSSHHAGNESAIRRNPTPSLSALAKRRQDEYNRDAFVRDSNYRALHDDLVRVMYLDRPSRLHFGPKP